MPRVARLVFLPALLALAACGGDAADDSTADADGGEILTTADAVTDAMLRRYESNLGAVEAFTVVGAGAEARYVLSDDTTGLDQFGPPEFGPASDGAEPTPPAQLLALQIPNVRRLASGLRTAALSGPITRDGRRAYALASNDPGALVGEPGLAAPDTTGDHELRVYVDAETFDVLEIYQSMAADTLEAPVTSRLIYSDFQETDGVVLPRTVRQVETGLDQFVSDDDRIVIGGQLGATREVLRQSPPSPRRDARLAEIEAQIRMYGEGISELALRVDSVRVGAGE